jgi:PAS domain-containing protein
MIGDNSKGARFVGMYEDITERKKAEEERRKLENRLRHAKKMESLGGCPRIANGY